MNLTLFRQLYESTFKAEPLLAGFWSVAMYDLEEESFSSWATMREKLEENARNQRKMPYMSLLGRQVCPRKNSVTPILPIVGRPLPNKNTQIIATSAMEAQAAAKKTRRIISSLPFFINPHNFHQLYFSMLTINGCL